MNDVKLADAEREQLRGLGQGQVPSVVETIIAARVAAARAEEVDRTLATVQELILDARDADDDGPEVTQGMVNAAAFVSFLQVRFRERKTLGVDQ